MLITIRDLKNDSVLLTSESEHVDPSWKLEVKKNMLFGTMELLTYWCNNDLEEECTFEVE